MSSPNAVPSVGRSRAIASSAATRRERVGEIARVSGHPAKYGMPCRDHRQNGQRPSEIRPRQKLTLFNPVVYLISGFRWSFYGVADVDVSISVAAILGFLAACLVGIGWIFKTGWKLKS